MKIVINKCFGGFGLSPKATARLAELRGQKAYFFTGGHGSCAQTQVPLDQVRGLFWSAYNTPTPASLARLGDGHSLSTEAKEAHNALYGQEHIDNCRDDRTNALLVQVVEELGSEANGSCSELRVIEIPDDLDYEIGEYDGIETVHECHQTWS